MRRPPTTIGAPATAAFCTSSKERRPLTQTSVSASGSRPSRKRPPDHLVEGVVPADVLADETRLPVAVEEPGRVQAAGGGEGRLRCAQPVREGGHDGRRDPQLALDPGRLDGHRLERALAADAAGGRRVEVAAQPLEVESPSTVTSTVFAARSSGRNASSGLDPFGEEESERELLVVAGRAHRDGHRLAVDPDLERLLDGQLVPLRSAARKPQDIGAGRGVRRQGVHYDRNHRRPQAHRAPAGPADRSGRSCWTTSAGSGARSVRSRPSSPTRSPTT